MVGEICRDQLCRSGNRPRGLSPRSLFSLLLFLAPLLALLVSSSAFAADPSIGVMVSHNWIQIVDFSPGASVTVSVNDGEKGSETVNTDASGFCQLSWWEKGNENRPLPGDKVTAAYGPGPTEKVEMIVQSLQGAVDLAADSASGTARTPEGSPLSGKSVTISVYSADWQTHFADASSTTDGSGAFTIDFLPFELVRGQRIFVTYYDAADGSASGNQTMCEFYNGIPSLSVRLLGNWLQGNNFPPETAITVSVANGTGPKGQAEVFTDANGNFWPAWGPEGNTLQFLPGDTVTASYDSATHGQATIAMLVQNVAAAVDLANDVVSGTARDGLTNALLNTGRGGAYITAQPNQQEPHSQLETDVVSGAFQLDFGGVWDIVRGNPITVTYTSPEGHQTMGNVYNRIPVLEVMVDHNWFGGIDFPPGSSVTVTVNAGAKGTATATTDATGYFNVEWYLKGDENRLLPGDSITAEYDAGIVEMVVPNLQAAADVPGNRVTGTAFTTEGVPLADRKVQVRICPPGAWEGNCDVVDGSVDGGGNFTLALTPVVLARGQNIWLTLWDAADGSASGNQTYREVYNGIPTLNAMIDQRWIRGNGFPPDTDVTVALNAGAKGETTLKTSFRGEFFIGWQGIGGAPQPGDTVTATYGPTTVEMLIQNLQVAVDNATNIVSGTAFDALALTALVGEKVYVQVSPAWNQQDQQTSLEATIGADGSFSLNFSGTWDIRRGNAVTVTYVSPAGHRTLRVPVSTDVVGRVTALDSGLAMEDVEVILHAPNGDEVASTRTDQNGEYAFTNRTAGAYKVRFAATDYNVQNSTSYLSEWHLNQSSFDSGNWIVLSNNTATLTVNATLEDAGGGIAGVVTDDLGGGMAGVWVCLQSAAWSEPTPNCTHLVQTGAGGNYSLLGVAPGVYAVLFYPGDYNAVYQTSYAMEWYGSTVTIAQGIVEQPIDAQLEQGGDVSGTVTGVGGAFLAELAVEAYDAAGLWAGEAETDVNGGYTILGLPPGVYTVRFQPADYNDQNNANYLAQWYQTESASPAEVEVTVGGTTPNISAQLTTGGRISGMVYGTGKSVLSGVMVKVFAAADGNTVVVQTNSGTSGSYLIRGVPPGDYKIAFDPALRNEILGIDYLTEWYDNKPSFLAATTVPVVKDGTAMVNAQLIRASINNAPVLTVNCNRTTLNEGQSMQCALTATDLDDDVLTFSAASFPAGSSFDANTGTFSWSPDYAQSGSYQPQFAVTDSGAGQLSDTETVTISVANVNRAPELAEVASQSIAEGQPLTITLSATDPDGNALTYSATNLPAGATLDPTTGAFSWTPTYTQSGIFADVRFTATDNDVSPLSSPARIIAITVSNVNLPPALAAVANQSVAEVQLLTFTLSATDPDGNAVTYAAENLPGGATLDPNTGVFEWTPSYAQGGSYENVRFTATDNGAPPLPSPERAITITVVNVNRAPTLAVVGNRNIAEGQPLSFTLSATDPDGNAVTYAAENLPDGATLDPDTGIFTWTPSYTQSGAYADVLFTATDTGVPPLPSPARTITITVANINLAPTLAVVGNQSVEEGQLLTFTLGATDPDGNAVTYSGANLPAGATLDPNTGVFEWTPSYTQSGTYAGVQFRAADDRDPPLQSPARTITISVTNVNLTPVLAAVENQSVAEGQLLTFTLSATEPDNDPVSYSGANLPAGATLDPNTGVFSWTPSYTQSGIHLNVQFTAADNGVPPLQSPARTITITVANVYVAPVLAAIENKSVAEGQTLSFTLSATDPDNGVLTYSVANLPAGASLDPTTGAFTWTPSYTQSGIYTNVQFTATDDSVPPLSSPTRTITITVTNVNQAPTLASVGDQNVEEGQPLTFTLSATDPDGNAVSYSGANLPAGATLDPATGAFSWTPSYTQSGTHADVQFTATDNGVPPLPCPARTITITVSNVNQAPTLASVGDQSVEEGQLLTFTLSATDPDGNAVTYSGANLPAGATLDPNTGVFSWTPSYTQSGSYTGVQFTATDNGVPPLQSPPRTIVITVTDHNPVLIYDRFTDGKLSGDPEWTRKSGVWSVDTLKRFVSGSLTAFNLSVVKKIVPTVNPVTAGRIEAKVMLTNTAAITGPDAQFVFAYQGPTKYRYVQFSTGKIVVGQVGAIGGVKNGWKKFKLVSTVKPAVWLAPRIDLLANGTVNVYLKGVLAFSTKFPTAAPGGIGLAALNAQSIFDDFKASDASILP